MFYVVVVRGESEYGFDDVVEIRRSPALTNSSREPRIEGWCGTTNGVAVYAHGAYESIDEARAAIAELFGEVREYEDPDPDPDTVFVGKFGKYEPIRTLDFLLPWTADTEINADTTDEEIKGWLEEYEAEANRAGFTIAHFFEAAMDILKRARDRARDRAKNDD